MSLRPSDTPFGLTPPRIGDPEIVMRTTLRARGPLVVHAPQPPAKVKPAVPSPPPMMLPSPAPDDEGEEP